MILFLIKDAFKSYGYFLKWPILLIWDSKVYILTEELESLFPDKQEKNPSKLSPARFSRDSTSVFNRSCGFQVVKTTALSSCKSRSVVTLQTHCLVWIMFVAICNKLNNCHERNFYYWNKYYGYEFSKFPYRYLMHQHLPV